ncbi:MAG: zinc ribbon domain-containing protein, partial [Oscillospiraceae bacterium]
MKCPECGAEINDNDVFCGSCGAEIIYNNINIENSEKEHNEESGDKKSVRKSKKSKNKNDGGKEKKHSFKTMLKIAGVIAAVIVIAIIIVCVLDSVKFSKGRKIFEQVPLGRDIDIIEADTGAAFISGENSSYGA